MKYKIYLAVSETYLGLRSLGPVGEWASLPRTAPGRSPGTYAKEAADGIPVRRFFASGPPSEGPDILSHCFRLFEPLAQPVAFFRQSGVGGVKSPHA